MNATLAPIGNHLEVVYLFYGLAFVLLGVAIALLPKDGNPSRLLSSLWLLAGFGLTHGSKEWVVLLGMLEGYSPLLEAANALLLLVSYLFLYEFGRRLTRATVSGISANSEISTTERWLRFTTGRWVYAVLAVGLSLGAASDGAAGLNAGSRALLGLPGSLLTAVGLARYARTNRERHESLRPLRPLRAAAAAFTIYGLLGGLVFDEALFLATFGIPVQLLRAACALAILVTMAIILRTYHADVRHRLRTELEGAQSSLVTVGRLSARNRLILEAAGQGIYGLDRQGKTTFVNQMAAEMLGWRAEDLLGRPHHALAHHTRADGSRYAREDCPIEAAARDGRVRHGDNELFWRKDGSSFEVEFTSTPVVEHGDIVGVVAAFRDVTEVREAQRHLRQAALVLKHMPEGVVIADPAGRIESVNPAFEKGIGYASPQIVGKSPRMLRSPRHDRSFYRRLLESLRESGRWQGEIWIRRKSGEIHAEWLSINALRDAQGRVTNYIGIFSDIETHRDVRKRLHHLAYYDALTNLPNRLLFRDHLDLALAQARRERDGVAVLFVDLDRFKHINDTLGHRVGDQLLRTAADRIKSAVRESDTVARLGGDEFTAILPGLDSPLSATTVARKILRVLEQPFFLEGREFYITASIGISIYPEDGEDCESLTRMADIAMYRAKESGRNNFQIYQQQMSTRFGQIVTLESELRGALDRKEIHLVYQPLIDLRSGQLVGVEALARWNHPRLGDVSPTTFISIAEETDLIERIGEWVLRRACRDASSWTAVWPEAHRVAVNVSARQLHRGGFPRLVAGVLQRYSLPPDALALELTESVMAEHAPGNREALRELSDMGVQITIDDFGTGYSSLSYLRRFAVDKLKIDESFVRDIPTDPNDRALASMIIALAHASNMRVTAEGVETTEQLEFLREQGCDEIQGFLVSRPVPAEVISHVCRHQFVLSHEALTRGRHRPASRDVAAGGL